MTASPLELLAAALNSPLGVLVETEDAVRLRQRLYAEIRKDPDFANLSLLTSRTAPETELLIVKRNPDAQEP